MTLSRPRNELGWIIPKPLTASRAVYECMMSRIPSWEIYRLLRKQWGIPYYDTVAVMMYKIKNPKRHPRQQYRRSVQLDLFHE